MASLPSSAQLTPAEIPCAPVGANSVDLDQAFASSGHTSRQSDHLPSYQVQPSNGARVVQQPPPIREAPSSTMSNSRSMSVRVLRASKFSVPGSRWG